MLNYPGGKSHISEWIIQQMDDLTRRTDLNWTQYAEPFSGAFWVFLKMPIEQIKTFDTVVYNDFNFDLVNMITCLRDARIELIEAGSGLKLEDQETYDRIKEEFFTKYRNVNDMEILPNPKRAIQFAYLHHYSFIGSTMTPKVKMVTGKVKPREKHNDLPLVKKAKNPQFFEKIKYVTHIERKDCEQIIREFDSPDMFFYIDPPYWETEHYYTESVDGFGPKKHKSLANTIKAMKGRFALSYYSFNELIEWFPFDEYRWERKKYKSMMQLNEGGEREEVLILNDLGEKGLIGY
jgi:DNA adenine methylase